MQDNHKRSKNKSKKHNKERDQKVKTRLESENFKSNQAQCEFSQTTVKKVHNGRSVSPILIEETPIGSDNFVSFLQKDDKLVCEEVVSDFTFNVVVEQQIQEEEETEPLWEFMREQVRFEECYNHKKDYLNKQNQIQGHMVAILFDWLIEVTHSFHFKRETFYLAVNYVERYLMKQENIEVSRFQLLGVTAIFIAHKCEEIYPKTMKDFHRLTQDQYTLQDIEEMEVSILKSLEFRMNPNTPIFWINYYTKLWDDYLTNKGINNALFKEKSNESYFRYRELIQFYDLCLIDYRYQQNEKLTALSLIYLVAAKSLSIFEGYSNMAISSSEINEFFNSENEYNNLYREFIDSAEIYLEFDIKIQFEDLNEVICDVLKYLTLRLDNSLPRVLINNQQFIDDIQYEELLSFQTYNKYTMQTIKDVSKYFQ